MWTKFGYSVHSEDGCCDKKTYRPCRSDPQGRWNVWGLGGQVPINFWNISFSYFRPAVWGGSDFSYQMHVWRQV